MTLTESPSQTVEWYTPREAIDFVLRVFDGMISLDPCADMRRRIPARAHYTREDDGLSRDWSGSRVFVNPPYGRDIGLFVNHGAGQYLKCHSSNQLWLVPSRTDTAWWHRLTGGAYVAFPRGRYKFLEGSPDGTTSTAKKPGGKFPLCWVLLGTDYTANFCAAALDANMRVLRP